MKKNKLKLAIVASLFFVSVAVAQRDSVYVTSSDGSNSVVRGKVVASSVFKVTVDTEAGKKDVPCSEIRKISFAAEPRGLDRARDHFGSQRYDDCLDAIKKIGDPPESKFMLQEYKFLESFASGKKALRGDSTISTAAAEQILGRFTRENSDSFRLVPAVDLYAQLLLANGKSQQAQKEYTKLTKSRWPEFVNRGYFFEGEMLQHQGDLAGAKRSFQKLLAVSGTDAKTEEFKQLASCQLAKLSGLEGDVDSAIRALEKMIQEESSENTRLFAYAYNALGNCYLKSNELKKACRAFLHTELLFSAEADAHAEALYHLTKIWPQLKETERANRARSLLTSRYRNSIWASKL